MRNIEPEERKNKQIEEKRKERVKNNWAKVRMLVKKKVPLKKDIQLYKLIAKQRKEAQNNDVLIINKIAGLSILTFAPKPNFNYLTKFHSDQIDTTGSWVWEAEDIMAYFLYKNAQYHQSKTILELGAGTSGLASLFFALNYRAEKAIITDGKEQNIEYLRRNIKQNGIKNSIQACKYLWGSGIIDEKFDLILGADCLFFEQYHLQLVQTLCLNLEETGKALFINPSRGKSMQNFLSLLQSFHLSYQFLEFTDQLYSSSREQVKLSPEFNEEKDLYYFIDIHK